MKQTAYLSLTILLMILGITTQGQTQAFNNTKALNTEIIKDYLVWEADNTLPEAMEHCPYFTDNFKLAYKAFYIGFDRDLHENSVDFNPLTCCCDKDGLKVKAIKGNYVLYEGKTDRNKYLNARLVKVNGKTLIDGLGVINMPLIHQKLQKELWKQVWVCNHKFEEMDAQAMKNVVDDSKNGYLKVSGEYPTCGCECDVTIAAYKDQYGFYTLLRQDNESCDFKHQIMSNRLLSEILPEDFGLRTFIPDLGSLSQTNYAIFSLDIDIPHYGKDTKVYIKRLPLGLLFESQHPLVYYYANGGDKKSGLKTKDLYAIKEFAKKDEHQTIIKKLLTQDIADLNKKEQEILITTFVNKETTEFQSLKELQQYINMIKIMYNYYLQLEYDSVLLGWDKHKARFFIKEKYKAKQKMSFVKFLQNSDYWTVIC